MLDGENNILTRKDGPDAGSPYAWGCTPDDCSHTVYLTLKEVLELGSGVELQQARRLHSSEASEEHVLLKDFHSR